MSISSTLPPDTSLLTPTLQQPTVLLDRTKITRLPSEEGPAEEVAVEEAAEVVEDHH